MGWMEEFKALGHLKGSSNEFKDTVPLKDEKGNARIYC
jgi:hypothetical protein